MNVSTGEIRPWDSLTDEQKNSGEWIKLPSHDENGVAMAKPNYDRLASRTPSALQEFFTKLDARRVADGLMQPRRFDANGKPVP